MTGVLSHTRCERARLIAARDWRRVRLIDHSVESRKGCDHCGALPGDTCHTLEAWPLPCEPHLVRQKAHDPVLHLFLHEVRSAG